MGKKSAIDIDRTVMVTDTASMIIALLLSGGVIKRMVCSVRMMGGVLANYIVVNTRSAPDLTLKLFHQDWK